MGNRNAIKRFAGGLLIIGLLLGGGGLALAATTNTGSDGQNNSMALVCNSMLPGMQYMNSGLLQSVLDSMVADKTITQTQADQIIDQEKQIQTERQSQMDAVKSMTPEQRQAYFKSHQPAMSNPLAELVTAGTITQAQADEIIKVIHWGGGRDMGMHKGSIQGGRCAIGTAKTS